MNSINQDHRHNLRLNAAEARLDLVEAEAAARVVISVPVVAATVDCTQTDAIAIWGPVPAELNGYLISSVAGALGTAGVTGSMTVDITNRTQSDAQVLSTPLTFAAGVVDDGNAVIAAAEDDLTEGDVLEFDITTIHSGTAAKGLHVVLVLTKP